MTTPVRPPCCDHPDCQFAGGRWQHAAGCPQRLLDDTNPHQYAAALDGPHYRAHPLNH